MQILKALFGDPADLYEQALGLAARRQQVLTANLANVNTPGYQRQDMDFRLALADAESAAMLARRSRSLEHLRVSEVSGIARWSSLRRTSPRHLDLGAVPRASIKAPGPGAVEIDGGEVNMEREVTALAETQLQYDAVAMMARRYFQGLKSVIREGR
ncbi:MAG: hypothetical protein C4341_05220 [Armatimonadota bacterium]